MILLLLPIRFGLANIHITNGLGKKGSPAYEHFKSARGYNGGVVARCELVKYTACVRGKCAVKKTVTCRDVCKMTGFATHPKNHPMFKVPRVEKCLNPIMHRYPGQNGWQKPVLGKDGKYKVTSNYNGKPTGAKFSHGGKSDYGYCETWANVEVESCNKKLCEGSWGAVACREVAMTS